MQSAILLRAEATARRLLALEAGNGPNPLAKVCDKLRNHLGMIVGREGFRTLLNRALALGRVNCSALDGLRVTEDGTVDGIEAFASKLTPAQVGEASTALVGQVLGLLETFIGEALTGQLLGEMWPILKSAPRRPESRNP